MLEAKLNNTNLRGCYNLFSKNKEEGLVLTISDDNIDTCIWAFKFENSEDIGIVIADGNIKNSDTNLYNEKEYRSIIRFNQDEYEKAIGYIYRMLKRKYKNSIDENISYVFNITRNLNDIERIKNDASYLEYEDYRELAILEDKNTNIVCDLIINHGKFGLRYSFFNSKTEEYENLCFKECEIDITNDTTLFVDMKNHLDKFIDDEIDYNFLINSDFKL